jgi:hypothetical protein
MKPGVEEFRKGISTNIYGGTMPKKHIIIQKFKNSKFRKFKKKNGPAFSGSFLKILLWLGA